METLTYLPFWNKLTKMQQEALTASAREFTYQKGSLLHNGSLDCVGLFLVKQGQLRVFTISEEGKELTLYRLFERDICLLSASCIIRGLQFDVMVSAEEDTKVLHIPTAVYQKLMEESIIVANYTNELMASHFSEVMWLMDQIMNKKLDTRIAAFLMEESDLRGETKLLLTHEQIANHLGSVREVVTRMLKHFQNDGLLKLGRGSIELLDVERLNKLASDSLR
ncbi:MAG: transcriptional regulator, Crp/Fnr family [Evtepia sp.]|jgi:CRP/FNR family transcriptional regulator|nr:transcriptional regulator, Crp/Fnr family [Evtepia sp.]